MNSNLDEYMQWLQICLYYNSKDHIDRETVERLLEQLAVVVLHSDFMLSILSLTLVANMEVVTVATSSIDLWHNAGIEATKTTTTTAIRNAIRFVNGHRRKKEKKKQAAAAANETKQNKYEAAPLLRYNATRTQHK